MENPMRRLRPDPTAIEAASRASYKYEGTRKNIDFAGWDFEPEEIKAQWRASVSCAVDAYLHAIERGQA